MSAAVLKSAVLGLFIGILRVHFLAKPTGNMAKDKDADLWLLLCEIRRGS
jgi:hypothetical protein